MPITNYHQAWVTMVSLPSASIDHLPPRVDPSDLVWAEMLSNSWLVLAHTDFTKGTVTVWECCLSVSVPITNLYRVWARMAGLASASIDHSPPQRGPLRFRLSWNAVQFVSGPSTHWLNQRYCDGLIVLSECSHAYNKPLTALGKNWHPCFHLNWSFSPPPEWTPQILFELKYCPICEWF